MLTVYLSMLETEEDKNRFEQLYLMYKQDMYAIAYDILRNKEDAEDAVHQCFLKIADNFTKVSQISRNEIKAYFVIISRNTAINMYRQNKNRALHTTELNETQTVDESYFENRDYDELKKAIRQLPQTYKDVIYLYHLQKFSAKETGVQLGISPELVRKRAFKARKMLKEILSDSATERRDCNEKK
jgi:RNA polymerase sigma-70 factor (ECF subfamily)